MRQGYKATKTFIKFSVAKAASTRIKGLKSRHQNVKSHTGTTSILIYCTILHKHLHKQIGISITFRYIQRKYTFL